MELMRRSLQFMVKRKLAPAFLSWLSLIASASEGDRKKASMSRALLHLLHRELSRGWVGWHAQWQEAVRKRESARRGLKHLMNGKLATGFQSWVGGIAAATDAQGQRDSMSKSLL